MEPASTGCLRSALAAGDLIETAAENTPIIVDLDETLFLRNSTEEYLNSLQPRPLGAALLLALDVLKPWHWLLRSIRGERSRDWMRVVIATMFFPWTLMLWPKRAERLAALHKNPILLAALNKTRSKRKVLATLGFAPIVAPIVRHLGVDWTAVIACRFWRGAMDRGKGKLALVEATLGPEVVARAVLVTDPSEESELGGRVATLCCIMWPGARYIAAMSDVYVPFTYIEKVKHSKIRYVRDVILGDDIPLILLASSWISPEPILHAVAVVLLVFSFWCIYEAGYYENDKVAERFEEDPVLSQEYENYERRITFWSTQGWAIAIAIPGLALLQFSVPHEEEMRKVLELFSYATAIWLGFLLCVRLTFWCYNRVDKHTRSWIYPLLQSYRYFGCLTVTSTNLFGAMLLIAQVLARWFPYLVYRYVGGEWREVPVFLMRWVILLFLMIAIMLGSEGNSGVMSWQVLAIILYCTFRARKQLWGIMREARPITRVVE